MSLTIRDGYILKVKSPAQMRSFFVKLAPKLQDAASGLISSHLARRSTEIHDCIVLGRPYHLDTTRELAPGVYEGSPGHPLSLAAAELAAAHKRVWQTGHRDTVRDFNVNIFLMPMGRDGFLVRFVAEHGAFVDVWEACPEVAPFAYWNGSDRDRDMPKREWDRRARLWKSWDASLAFEWQLFPGPLSVASNADIEARIPSISERADGFARIDVTDDRMKVFRKNWRRTHSGEMPWHVLVHGLRLAETWMLTERGKKALDKRAKFLAARMATVGVEDLRRAPAPAPLGRRWRRTSEA